MYLSPRKSRKVLLSLPPPPIYIPGRAIKCTQARLSVTGGRGTRTNPKEYKQLLLSLATGEPQKYALFNILLTALSQFAIVICAANHAERERDGGVGENSPVPTPRGPHGCKREKASYENISELWAEDNGTAAAAAAQFQLPAPCSMEIPPGSLKFSWRAGGRAAS